MKIEILYNDYLIFGDGANVDYIKACLPEAEFIFTIPLILQKTSLI